MAVANWNSSATVKAVLLPLILVLLAMAAGASRTEDGPAVANSEGRFSETPVARKLLTAIKPCGSGKAPNYNCAAILPFANQPTCCTDPLTKLQACWDVGYIWLDKCGSCNTRCKVGSEICCSGVCANLLTDKNNCGICGHKCRGKLGCKWGLCEDY